MGERMQIRYALWRRSAYPLELGLLNPQNLHNENYTQRSMYSHGRVLQRGATALVMALGIAFPSLLLAETEYSARIWEAEEGLPHHIVQALDQTSDGYLWVGTREGLARFDGASFKTVELARHSRPPSVISLRATPDGALWAGTEGAGLFRIEANTIAPVPGPNGSTNFTVHELHVSNGELWMASSLGVFRHTASGLERYADFRGSIESLCVDGTGAVWHARSRELKRLHPGPVTSYRVHSGQLPPDARKLYWRSDGSFWIASGAGITQVKDGSVTFHRKSDGPAGFVSAFLNDSGGEFWLGSYAGLSRFADGKFTPQEGQEGSSYRVFALFEDAEKSVWVGSEEGLTRLTPKTFRTYTRRDGLTLNTIVTVCASRDGGVWVGVWGGGLNRIQDGTITSFGKAEGLSSEFVMAMCEGRDGSLWVGADYGNALNRIKNGKVTLFDRQEGLVPGAHTALLEDAEGRLWIGSRNGLQTMLGNSLRRYGREDGLSHEKINALCLSRDDAVWIGTAGGLSRAAYQEIEDWSTRDPLLKAAILCLYEDTDGSLWLGTDGIGLLHMRGTNVARFSSETGLLSDSIYSVQPDDSGNLWLGSSRGIFRVARAGLEALAAGEQDAVTPIGYGKSDGILSSGQYREVTQPAACRSIDGRLWFRTPQGVAVVDPARININRRPPPVTIEEVIGDRKPVWQRLGSGPDGTITIPKGRGELEIRYTALSLRAAERNRFRYQLEGIDRGWVEAGGRRSAYYNKVAPGEYVFRVTACNNDGLWNPEPKVLRLEVLPHFWQTRSFLAIALAAALGCVISAAAWISRVRIKRELRRMEQQHAIERERSRIARDMHDELGAKLARISFQGATAKRVLSDPAQAGPQVEKMAETARELVTSLDEIVWAVDPANDSLEHLAGYICRYAGQFFEESSILCEFEIPENLPPWKLSSDVRHHLFLAYKEALTNVMRHAEATKVRIILQISSDTFELHVADNGRGISTLDAGSSSSRPKRVGHGLNNIRERLESTGGRAEITSGPQGTTVRLVVPLSAACHPFI
jgi:ligand-binding sensor domain-containing protein/signal transduction histidine kinase